MLIEKSPLLIAVLYTSRTKFHFILICKLASIIKASINDKIVSIITVSKKDGDKKQQFPACSILHIVLGA